MIVAGDITASALFGGNQGTLLGNSQIWHKDLLPTDNTTSPRWIWPSIINHPPKYSRDRWLELQYATLSHIISSNDSVMRSNDSV